MESLTENSEILTKACTKCGEVKPYEGFHRHKGFKCGREAICKVCSKAKTYAYRQKNPDAHKNIVAKYRAKNPEAARASVRNWHQKNPEYEQARYKRRRQDPQQVEKMRASGQRRKARHRVASEIVDTLTLEQTLWLRSQCCSYCMGKAGELDHVVPLASGGDNSIDNIVPCCRKCNASKGAKSLLHFFLARKRHNIEVAHGVY